MKGQGQRQLGPWPGLGVSDGLHHPPSYDMKPLNFQANSALTDSPL